MILILRNFIIDISNNTLGNIIRNFKFSENFNSHQLVYIKYESEYTLLPLAQDLHTMSDSLNVLDFNPNQLDDAINLGLIPFLENLKSKADEQLEFLKRKGKINLKKFEDFTEEFLDGYTKNRFMKDLFKFFDLYQDHNPKSEDINIYKLEQRYNEEKTIFFEDWYVDNRYFGCRLGEDFARFENLHLLTNLLKKCRQINDLSLSEFLNSDRGFLQDFILVRINAPFHEIFSSPEHICDPEYFKSNRDNPKSGMHPQGLVGCYVHNGFDILLFDYSCYIPEDADLPNSGTLLLNKNNMGKFIQHEPNTLNKNHKIKQNLSFAVDVYSENQDLMEQLIKDTPNWLSGKGNETKQKEYLEGLVLIHIYEKFNFEIDSNFIGFLFPV